MKKFFIFFVVGFAFLAKSYCQAGSLDPSFGGKGWVSTDFDLNPSSSGLNAIAIQSDGKIVVAGNSNIGGDLDIGIARYNPDGSLDNTFDGDGRLTTSLGSSGDNALSVAIQVDGKIVVAGTSNNDFAIVRYNTDGSLDVTFDGDGIKITSIGASIDIAESVAIQNDGKIVVGGRSRSNRYFYYDFALARYNTDGSLDVSFSGDGIVITSMTPYSNEINSVAIQSDGKIVVGGEVGSGYNADFAVVRYNADGTLDNTFDGDGKQTTAIGISTDVAESIAIQNDGKIVAAGSSNSSLAGTNYDFALVRYNADGSLDNTFDGDGKLTSAIGILNDLAYAVAVQTDGKIVAAGYGLISAITVFAIARYNSDGSLDNTFAGDGKILSTTPFTGQASSVAINNNRLYVAGNSSIGVIAAYLLQGIEISCPTNQSVFTTAATCNAVVNSIDPILTPTEATATINYTLTGATTGSGTGTASGKSFNKGITTVTYTLADDPTKTCSFTVTVNDNELPALTCPSDVVLCYNSSGNYTISPLQATDNCVISTTTYTITGATTRSGTGNNASGALNPGINSISWTVIDESGNSNTCQVSVTVNPALVVTIPDTVAFFTGVELNTVYIGFSQASSIVLKAQVSGGDNSYTYLWSTGATTPSITVSPTVTTNYSVTVTDGQGCTQTASRQVIVRDVRCGNKMDKVQVCRIFPRESRTLCVSPVQAYVSLLLGASLGSCEVTAVAGAKEQAIETTGSLNVKVTPNPSNYFFTMVISGSNSNRPISVRVMDGASRLVEARSNIASKTTIQLGHQYRPGIYYAEVIQGGEKVIVKMIKQP